MFKTFLFRDNKLNTKPFIKSKDEVYYYQQIDYHFYLKDYVVMVSVSIPEGQDSLYVTLGIMIIYDDENGDSNGITISGQISPMRHEKFMEFEKIQEIFSNNDSVGKFYAQTTEEVVEKVISILKIVSKIDKLTVFL